MTANQKHAKFADMFGTANHLGKCMDIIASLTKDDLEDTPRDLLMSAVRHGNTAIVALLLDKGLRSGFALDAAVHQTSVQMVTLLLNGGVAPTRGAVDIARRLEATVIEKLLIERIKLYEEAQRAERGRLPAHGPLDLNIEF